MSEVIFSALSAEDAEQIRLWRNENIAAARTPYLLTREMQLAWYHNVVCNRDAKSRYWAIWSPANFIGIAGLQNIEWENSTAEISLMIGPEHRRKGHGKAALEELLRIGFQQIGLHSIWGEVYVCAQSFEFWRKIGADRKLQTAFLPDRKFWNGKYWPAVWFCFME